MMDLLTVVEWLTVVVTFIVLGSGLPGCISMYKTGSNKNVPYPLFLVYSFVNVLSLKYGVYNDNFALVIISLVSLLVFGSYITIYIMVSKSKGGPLSTLIAVLAVYLAHLFYLTLLPSEKVVPTIGTYMLMWCTILAVLPLLDILKMLREQSAQSCDVPILISSTISAAIWYWYGSLSQDVNIWAPNVPAMVLNAVKFILLWYFGTPSKSVVHPVPERQPKNGFVGHDFHKEVYNVRARKPLQQD